MFSKKFFFANRKHGIYGYRSVFCRKRRLSVLLCSRYQKHCHIHSADWNNVYIHYVVLFTRMAERKGRIQLFESAKSRYCPLSDRLQLGGCLFSFLDKGLYEPWQSGGRASALYGNVLPGRMFILFSGAEHRTSLVCPLKKN